MYKKDKSPTDILREALKIGSVADFSSNKPDENYPASGSGWRGDRIVSADTIIDFCTKEALEVHAKGVRVRGARISGTLDFEGMKLLRPLHLEKCSLEKQINLNDAETKTLSLDGSYVPGIVANRIKVRGSLLLGDGFYSNGEIQMIDATVEGSISCQRVRLSNAGGYAFRGYRISVGGGFLITGDSECFGEISLLEAKLGGSLGFEGTKLRNPWKKTLDAERLTTKGGVYFRKGFESSGRVKLHGAQVEGIVEFAKGNINGSNNIAVEARGLRAKGAVIFRNNFTTHGVVNLSYANIGATLEFDNAHCNSGGKGHSVEASEAVIGSIVEFTNRFTSQGSVSLDGASIGGGLKFENAKFDGKKGDEPLLSAARISVKHNLDFHTDTEVKGMVSLVGAEIGGNVHCRQAAFLNEGNIALKADLIAVKGEVLLESTFRSDGELLLAGAKLGAGLRVDQCKQIKNSDGVALNCDRLLSAGTVSLIDSDILGEFRVSNAAIGADLLLTGTKLGSGKIALNAAELKMDGNAFLNGEFEARGDVNLTHAHIGGKLDCGNATFNGEQNAFDASYIEVVETLKWKGVKFVEGAHVNLTGGAVGTLDDDCLSWHGRQQLSINGFSYGALGERTLDLTQRLSWLRSQHAFSVQPYEQLIRVLRNTGNDKEAREVARAKQDDLRRRGDLDPGAGVWNWLSGKMIGHGYQLWRALIASVIVISVGALIFHASFASGIMQPVKDKAKDYPTGERCPQNIPCFNPVIYSLDVFLPIVDLRQESYWLPVANYPKRGLVEYYYWLHVILGWVFTTLSVAGLTGLVKKE
jgi:hypothetical protein